MKFAPHYSGKQQVVTYDMVRDHIIQQIQKTFRHGNNMAKALRDMAYEAEPGGGAPRRRTVVIPVSNSTTKIGEGAAKIEQDGYDILYAKELCQYMVRKIYIQRK